MTWEDIVMKDPKQGPRISFDMFEEKQRKQFRNFQDDIRSIAHKFKRNSKFLKDLIGKEGAEEVMDGIILALESYAKYITPTLVDTDDNPRYRERNKETREGLERSSEEFMNLANELKQAKK